MFNTVYYINIPNLKGSSTNPRHSGASEIQHFGYSQNGGVRVEDSGGKSPSPSPKVTFEFQLNGADILTPYMLQKWSSVDIIPEIFITIEMLNDNNEFMNFTVYKFNDCRISSVKKVPKSHNLLYAVRFLKFEIRQNWIETW